MPDTGLSEAEEAFLDAVGARLRAGWTQGRYGEMYFPDGDVCLAGAWIYVRDQGGQFDRSSTAVLATKLLRWLNVRYPDRDVDLVWLNDHVAESVEDVLLELKLFREGERHADA